MKRICAYVPFNFQDATKMMILFHEAIMQSNASGTDERPTESASVMADLILEAFSVNEYLTPRIPSFSTKYLPETIFESKSAENVCMEYLVLEVTPAVTNLKNLSCLNDSREFDETFSVFNYTQFTDDMITYVDLFEKCTAYYSSYLDSVASFAAYFDTTAKTHASFGRGFIFEKRSQVRINKTS